MPPQPSAPAYPAAADLGRADAAPNPNGVPTHEALPSTATARGTGKVRIVSWAARARRDTGPIGWAAFLASSWTWCIGMFLPVLMLRDYGGWGWTVFAIPNVLGAAAMGWILRDRDVSRAVQEANLPACRWFSIITIAFHAFFVLALIPRLIGDNFIALAIVMLAGVTVVWGRRGSRAPLTAALVLAVSVLAMLGFVTLQGLGELPTAQKPRVELLWLAPVCAFGFFLAPYLDLTFHRARQSSTRAGGRTAFGVGFGVFFLLMIIFTALYARPLIEALEGERNLSIRGDLFVAVLAVHLAIQAAFTVVAHTDAVAKSADSPPSRWWKLAAGAAAIVGVALLMRWVALQFPLYHGLRGQTLNSSELIYRVFMAFYGLVFPTYVWLFMVPSLRHRRPVAARPPRTATLVFFAGVVVLAAPGFWMGFIEGQMLWMLPALALILVSRALLPKGPPAVPAAPAPA